MGRTTIIRLDGARYFRPEEFSLLKQAVDRAWDTLPAHGVGDDGDARLILAKGVMAAARSGERELTALTLAACRHWARSSEPNRAQRP